MNKYLRITSLVLFFILISILGIFFYKNILDFLISIDVTKFNFLVVYITICLIYFIFPLPVTLIIILNGYLFKDIGFYISFSLILLSSTIIFFSSKFIETFFKLNIKYFFLKKNIKIEKLTSNSYSILISRYIVPFFFHNLYYGLMKIDFKRFFIIIFLAEIPMTYAINTIGKSLKNFTTEVNFSIYDLFIDKNFYVPFFIIVFIFFFMKCIRKSL
tara:strand:+ start:91 stop:738 length:648 start_codon:yes stop_codon:yes gene_type:complete